MTAPAILDLARATSDAGEGKAPRLTVSANQRKVLTALDAEFDTDAPYVFFRTIARETGLELRLVRLACRALKRKGLAHYSVTCDDDYRCSGSGYGCSMAGHLLLQRPAS